jgi:outer membrane biogenesis lipoprotein LolB
MKHGVLALFSLVVFFLLSACASSSSGKNADGTPKDEQSVNSLPWNKPASWEGGSGIPGGGGK